MEIIYIILFGVISLVILGVIALNNHSNLSLEPLKVKLREELKAKSNEELIKEVFSFEEGYFSFIGEENPEVIEFKTLVLKKDLESIKSNWKRLSKKFDKLEKKAGHTGRPLILDYYCWYEMWLNELSNRNT